MSDLRRQYARAFQGLTYHNATRDEVRTAMLVLARGAILAPKGWVELIERIAFPCRRCVGTGAFITGTLNGVPTGPGGDCFRCGGKGKQNAADGHRNACFDSDGYYRDATGAVQHAVL